MKDKTMELNYTILSVDIMFSLPHTAGCDGNNKH